MLCFLIFDIVVMRWAVTLPIQTTIWNYEKMYNMYWWSCLGVVESKEKNYRHVKITINVGSIHIILQLNSYFYFLFILRPKLSLEWILIFNIITIFCKTNHPLPVAILKIPNIICIHLFQLIPACGIGHLHPMRSPLLVKILKIHHFYVSTTSNQPKHVL